MSRIARTESVGDSLCPVCHEHTEIYAIGPCDHPICYKCSTRMRVLCNQMYCPICRGDLPQIVFLTKKRKYEEVNRRDCIPNRKYKILMEDESVEDAYEALLEHRCRICEKGPLFDSFGALQNHMRRVHTLFACDLCVNHLKIFPYERKFYNRKDLAVHRRSGDPDNRSYRGHPLCRFCDERYMDSDELLRHLRKSHYYCHFCDANNSNEYFDDYPDLKEHFRAEHYLCEEGQCGSSDTRFTNAFASEIDLKAHKAAEHMGNKSKAQAKELRTIDLNFQVAPRRRGRDATVISPEDYEEVNAAGRGHRDRHTRRNEHRPDSYSRSSNATPPPEVTAAPSPRPPALEDDFPTLGNGPAPYIPQKKPTERVEDFPSLSAQRSSGSTAVTTSSSLVSSSTRPAKPRPNSSQKPPSNFSSMAAAVTSAEASRPSSSFTQVRPSGAQSRPAEVSRPAATQAATSTTWAASKPPSAEDFPSLGASKKGKPGKEGPNYVSLGVWSKKQKDNAPRPSSAVNGRQSPVVSKASSLAALGRALCDDGEFPTLGGGGGSGANKVPGASWVMKNGNASKNKDKKSSGSSSSTPLGKTRDPAVNSKSKAKQEQPVLVNGVSENKTEETKSKKKKKKQKGNEDDSKSANEDSGISLSSIASEIDASALMPVSDPGSKKQEEERKQDSPVLNSLVSSSVKETSTSSSQARAPVSSTAESSSLTEEKENRQWETVGTRKFKGFQEEDFPSLQGAPKKTAPPPGFQRPAKVTAPPPGLNKPAQALGRTPPGLGSAAAVSPASSSSLGSSGTSIPLSVKLNMYNYVTPPDAPDRNRALVARVRELLEPKFAGFDQFRTLSADYRSGQVTAQDYHKKCQDLFGKERFLEVLPELVALLPDILKQHELAQAHKQDVLGICAPLDLQACPTCQQLLKADDLTAHLTSHTTLASDIAGFSAAASLPIKT